MELFTPETGLKIWQLINVIALRIKRSLNIRNELISKHFINIKKLFFLF